MLSSLPLLRSALGSSAVLLLCATTSQALTINLDYSHDTFFAGNATAQATLEKAATDVSWAITTALSPLSQDMFSYTHTDGPNSTTATADFHLRYTNPETGGTETLNTYSFINSEFRIFVGGRDLLGSTLGQGGPGAFGFSGGGSSIGTPDFQSAVDGLLAEANPANLRGGPILSTLALDLAGASGTIEMGYSVGNLWFDTDTDNDGFTDSASTLAANWHFDYNTPVEAGKDDLYSVAVHEMLHSIGFGTGNTWNDMVSGTDWLGTDVIDLLGSGVDVVHTDGAHVAAGLTGTPIVDGVLLIGDSQEAIMDPSLTVGSRKYITDLDLAFLADMGWGVASPVPEPRFYALACGLMSVAFLGWRRRRS